MSYRFLIRGMGLSFCLILGLMLCTISCSDDNSTSPSGSGDFWTTATPESVGMNAELLDELTEDIDEGAFGTINSILVVKDDKLVYEEYFRGASRDDQNMAEAVTRNVMATLIGIAQDEGKLSLDDRILGYFTEFPIPGNMSAWKSSMTIRDILEMRSGFKWDELKYPVSDNRNSLNKLLEQDDYYGYLLSLEVENEPGTVWNYNSGAALLLAQVIYKATGMDAISYAEEKLFEPLGITNYKWYKFKDPSGYIPNTVSGLNLRPRDMAKLAYLYLNEGVWEGQQIVSEDWIYDATTPYVDFGDHGYGYFWWVDYVDNGSSTTYMPCTTGYGDQNIMYCKILDLVIVTTSKYRNNDDAKLGDIIRDYIAPAIGN